MSENDVNVDVLLDGISKFTEELGKLEKCFENQDDLINNKLEGYDTKINNLNKDFSNLNETINKLKEYLLLELESSLDKHKQIQLKNENKYDDLLVVLKNNDDEKISK